MCVARTACACVAHYSLRNVTSTQGTQAHRSLHATHRHQRVRETHQTVCVQHAHASASAGRTRHRARPRSDAPTAAAPWPGPARESSKRRPALQTNRKRAHSSGPLARASEGKPRSDSASFSTASRVLYLQCAASGERRGKAEATPRGAFTTSHADLNVYPHKDGKNTPRSEYFSDGVRCKQTAGAPTASRGPRIGRVRGAATTRAAKPAGARSRTVAALHTASRGPRIDSVCGGTVTTRAAKTAGARSRTRPRARTHGLLASERNTPGERATSRSGAAMTRGAKRIACAVCEDARRRAKVRENVRKCAAP